MAAEAFRRARADLVVIACNTASTIALAQLRDLLPVPIVGVVPAIKPASLRSRTGIIGLLGTERTVTARYTDALIAEFAPDLDVIRVGAPNLVIMAETLLSGGKPDTDAISQELGAFQIPDRRPDVVILACTHFPLLRQEITAALSPTTELVEFGACDCVAGQIPIGWIDYFYP